MKTLKFIIPRTAASIMALIDSLNSELTEVGETIIISKSSTAPAPADVDTGVEQDNTKTDNVVDIKPAVPAPEGVDVDEDGIPWDPRIHSGKKTKLVKGNTWKLKRGVDAALVETVIAELKATMSATGASETTSAPAPAAKTTAPAPAPAPSAPAPAPAPEVVADPIYIVEGSGEFTAEQLKASNWTDEQIGALPIKEVETTNVTGIILFPDLMAAITAAGLDEATVLTAVQNQGIQATPLLASRPDLVPAVYAELFPS